MASQMAQILSNYRQTMPSGGLERGVQNFFTAKSMGEQSKLRQKQTATEDLKQEQIKQEQIMNKLAGPVAAADTNEKWVSAQAKGFLPKDMDFGQREPFIMGMMINKGKMDASQLLGKPQTGEEAFNQETKLRSSFEKQAGDFVKVRDAYGRITASASDPSAAGDLALIFNYMKVLDPGSTVREGEFATAQNAGGVGDRIMNMYNRVVSGERLNEKQRTDFVGRASKLYKSQLKGLEGLEKDYTAKAKRYGLNPENIITQYRVDYEKQPGQAQQPPAQPGQPQQPGQAPAQLPPTNEQGWTLMRDAQGNQAYVGPNGEVQEIQ